MKTLTYSIFAAALACGFVSATTTAYTTPVGYMTVPLPGTGGGSPQTLQLANQGLLPSGPAYAAGGSTVTFGSDGTGTYLQDTNATWAAGAYVNGSNVSSLLEITSAGSLKGAMSWITSSATQKLYTADNLSAAGAGASYRVWAAYTMASLFGNPPDAAVLAGGSGAAGADNVEIYNPLTNSYQVFWYKNAGKGTMGWVCEDSSVTDATNYAIHPNDGLVLLRKQSADGSLVISGSVKDGQTMVRVDGDATPSTVTLNILGTQVPVDQLTPGNSGLYTGDPSTGLQGSSGPASADNLLVFDAPTNSYKVFWYKNAGKGTMGWVCEDASVPDATNFVIPSTGAVLIQRKAAASFNWTIPAVSIAP